MSQSKQNPQPEASKEKAMNAATLQSSRSLVSCLAFSKVAPQPKLDNTASTKLYATASANEQPGRTFLDILLRCLSAPAA